MTFIYMGENDFEKSIVTGKELVGGKRDENVVPCFSIDYGPATG